jgi:hypothetical protein
MSDLFEFVEPVEQCPTFDDPAVEFAVSSGPLPGIPVGQV